MTALVSVDSLFDLGDRAGRDVEIVSADAAAVTGAVLSGAGLLVFFEALFDCMEVILTA